MNLWKCSTVALALALGLVVSTGAVRTAAADAQPKMQEALEHLERAEQALSNASTDKGGYRVKALASTRAAIKQVKDGIRFDNKHDGEKDKDADKKDTSADLAQP